MTDLRPHAPPKPEALREAIAHSLWEHVKAYDLGAVCERLGLEPTRDVEDPYRSKMSYVMTRLQTRDWVELVTIAQALLEEWDDDELQGLVERAGARGVTGEMKNLIFASVGRKPQIVLRDAVANVIDITDGADRCLIYDRPLPNDGLTWSGLVDWWATEVLRERNTDAAARHLWSRLAQSLESEPERILFRAYTQRYGQDTSVPALLPQVWLHYDPFTRRPWMPRPEAVIRQRMDFLLLLPNRRRVVLEVDGKHHYAREDGRADPGRYATMVSEDRRLRLAGYEVYRFGGAEFSQDAHAELLESFFEDLFRPSPKSHL